MAFFNYSPYRFLRISLSLYQVMSVFDYSTSFIGFPFSSASNILNVSLNIYFALRPHGIAVKLQMPAYNGSRLSVSLHGPGLVPFSRTY